MPPRWGFQTNTNHFCVDVQPFYKIKMTSRALSKYGPPSMLDSVWPSLRIEDEDENEDEFMG